MATDNDDQDFPFHVNSHAVSLLAKNCGFDSIQRSALHTLTETLEDYLENLLAKTHLYAELGNRTRPNYHDVIRSLEESGMQLPELGNYLNQHREDRVHIPLANQKSSIQTEEKYNFLSSDDEEEENTEETTSLPEYAPSHMPKFPSRHSFRQTPVYIHRPDDPQRVRELNSQQSRVVEENLKRLMSAENQLLRRHDTMEADMFDLSVPIVNYESAIQRKKRVKRAHTGDIRSITTKNDHSPKPNNNNNNTTPSEISTR
ncbi:hypothetical protein O0I10_009712 [Lichtheimia ornata]|uniref:Transcription initiation factor TFIID subunit 8 n=1 Tax=Lichtheimia ornata TaxID=688661 RepID=A0AAD7UXE0_9FUNG|nr:uncharacterized protein O0I10_009712 [Lichtheimia ornata]KAJ8654661.1 hypothetical protein O0I10_009712 [Lichtheimia ornata]